MSLSLLFSQGYKKGIEDASTIPGRTSPGARVALQHCPILLVKKSYELYLPIVKNLKAKNHLHKIFDISSPENDFHSLENIPDPPESHFYSPKNDFHSLKNIPDPPESHFYSPERTYLILCKW